MERLRFAKRLRTEQTDAEQLLWQHLRAKRLLGLKFRRQKPIGPFIVDFICQERMLVVEVDGGQHLESESDKSRDTWMARRGFTVLRFWNHEVLLETEAVLEAIRLAAEEAYPGNPLSPGPSP
ncbi:endonuclease domain-containing protein [Pseudomonas resinovorans]|uniref:endonuclease domain-containing protein n=1 Tax=Metapseudomonas resinovorans TaxID=53412 RepID=UPI00237F97D3|nr:endonuclease domain-containing protein [Pseudomonas resinovorans]MDE3739795.1 endonuclease domain-containing protein [Pseudomonas resinovorans]